MGYQIVKKDDGTYCKVPVWMGPDENTDFTPIDCDKDGKELHERT